ncbi:signal transduction histidine kinase [Krasilnikovia cinnamomea]|uniref:histidine kinase n=1 Tax=Krasilnikovia cinnamomea TaxID=349313 RepID=A0A4V2G7F5_9ACTN|nr:nitrate- and nitrite sensing domain-containing protein [Krasilnikovia cinnamomea]RZU52426.1 signal transduction histidine kinase [Krasilnikovia cinnamomea]
MRTRNWSIRSKIIALVTVPLTALLALWIFATVLTAGPAFNLLSARTLLDTVGHPGEALVGELQRERRLTVAFLASTAAQPTALDAQRAVTDRAVATFRRSATGPDAQQAASQTLRTRIAELIADLDGLAGNRAQVDLRQLDPVAAQRLYNTIVDAGFQLFTATATFNDELIDRQVRALTTVGRGQEYLSRTDSLLAGADAAGRLTADLRHELLQSIATARFLLADGVADLPPADRAAFQRLSAGPAFSRLRQMQDVLVETGQVGQKSPVGGTDWQPVYDSSTEQLRAFELAAADSLAQRATPLAMRVLGRLGAAGILGLVAVAASIFVSVRVGRSLVGRLIRLRGEALEMAGERLPGVIRRLQRGEAVDVDVETPPLEYGRDEIGQLGHAFNEVQRTAVQSAVEEANVRRGINEVFLNIARRSQTLLHRQLALLDKMERRETEPRELEDLYRVDHLATRMRRHAEDLVILAGAAPGRGWRNPVPVIDVIRGAISEVEDYKRIDIRSVESSAVLGRAVGDVIHLLAELLENAASFSPPHTRVEVIGQILPNGYALEVEDRGLGMTAEAIEDANRRLLEPPDFDPADSARLGLFVVAQLAGRHGVRVSLRPSAYGGVTAVVLIPGELVTAAPPGPGQPALPAGPSPADKAWDRPLVGSGTQDPARRSLAALQWQGAEELRSITVTGRPVTLDGTVAGAEPDDDAEAGHDAEPVLDGGAAPGGEADQPRTAGGGPSRSAVVDGLSADGLVRRRRTAPRRAPQRNGATVLPAGLERPDPLLRPGPGRPGTGPGRPSTEHPGGNGRSGTAGVPLSAAPDADAAVEPSSLDGLPRRVRQANLVPQLREPAAPLAAVPARSPERVRDLMSALQRGTIRGRQAAAGAPRRAGDPPAVPVQPAAPAEAGAPEDKGFSEAATVLLPAVRDTAGPDQTSAPPPGAGDGGGTATQDDHGNRPEKDA